MSAPIEKSHRAQAFSLLWTCKPYPAEERWIETGEGLGSSQRAEKIAQALADLEAAKTAAEDQVRRIHFAIGRREAHQTIGETADCVIEWIASRKGPGL